MKGQTGKGRDDGVRKASGRTSGTENGRKDTHSFPL